jgi:hypothetical protein
MYNYDEYEKFWKNPLSDYQQLLQPYLISVFESHKHNNVLEIGFGSAHLPNIMHRIGFSGKYKGIDLDSGAIEFASKMFTDGTFTFETFKSYSQLKDTSWDLAIFCLSICEMSDQVVLDYLQSIKAKNLLIINPSTTTNYFDSRITKPFINKISTRFGAKPRWNLIAKIPNLNEKKRTYLINNNTQIPASMYYRSTGDLLNLVTKSNYKFKSYIDLKYSENTIKTAPVSKFEVLWFER